MSGEVALIGSYAPSLHLFRGNLIRALAERGYTVRAYAAEKEPPQAVLDLPLTYESWPLQRGGTNPLADARALDYLRRSLRRHKPVAVLSYTIKAVIYGSLAAEKSAVPKRYAMITGLGYAFGKSGSIRQQVVSWMVPTMYRRALEHCHGVFLQNRDDLRDLKRYRALHPTTPITMIPGSGVDLQRYAPRGDPATPMRFLYIGRLLTEKGITEFVEAAALVKAEHPDVQFVVVGSLDPNPTSITRADLEEWISGGLIEYRGQLEDVRPEIEACSVLVLPSYREGTPRSVLEAMAMARPVIVSDAPGCRETVVDGETGRMVPVRDVGAVADAMRAFIQNPELIRTMGEAARTYAERKFDDRSVNATILETMGL